MLMYRFKITLFTLLAVIVLLSLPLFAAEKVQPPQPENSGTGPEYNLLGENKGANLSRVFLATPADSAHDYDVLKYTLDVKLVPSVASNKFRGHTTIKAKSQILGLSTLVLGFIGMTVDSCEVNTTST